MNWLHQSSLIFLSVILDYVLPSTVCRIRVRVFIFSFCIFVFGGNLGQYGANFKFDRYCFVVLDHKLEM